MKKYLTLLLVCYFFVPVLPAHAVAVNLSPQEVEEAIAFGNTNRSSIEKDLDGSYAFGSAEEYAEGGVVHTKWYKLAFMAAQKARHAGALSAPEQAEIVSDPCLQINLKVYGRSLDFARDYQVTLLQGAKVIKLEKIHADSFSSDTAATKSMTGFPGCWAIMRIYFRYDTFNPAAPAILTLKKDGKESHFQIDFKRYK
ncbi:MAG: hypothetical protein NTV89_15055 [Proteobacteria bacterium]|nr:hypothetical protein [Pseudomonadota bacterium]